MFYVYVLQSLKDPAQQYVGFTENIANRLEQHNAGFSEYTSKYIPLKIILTISFENKYKALKFEEYLKTSSGKSFMKKRLIE